VLSPSGALQCGGARESRDGNQISNEYADPHSSTHTTGILTHNAHPRRHDTAKMHFLGRSLALAVTVGVTAAVDVPFSSCSSSDALGELRSDRSLFVRECVWVLAWTECNNYVPI